MMTAVRPDLAFRRALTFLLVVLVCVATTEDSEAAPLSKKARKAIVFVQKGDCVSAVPLLEDAELFRHSPITAISLAECYVVLGELVQAAFLFRAIADEKPAPTFGPLERAMLRKAKIRAPQVEARVPTLEIELEEEYAGLVVTVADQTVMDMESPVQLPPDTTLVLKAEAKGYESYEEEIVLREGEKRVVSLRLVLAAKPKPKKPKKPKPGDDRPPRSEVWIGAKFRGFLIPQFVMDAVGDGGTNVFAPGGALAVTLDVKPGVDLALSLGYSNYRMGETPFKADGAPNTEWEIIDSDLQAFMAALDLMVDVPLDADGNVSFRIGGAVGIGWTFLGDIHRTQAYPVGDPDEPDSYRKCNGPNDPAGQFRYCNQLDKDKDHYDGFSEPSWFDGGSRPLVYPYLSLPQLGLSWYPTDNFALDLETGLTISGLVTGLGMRLGL